jgi:aldose 1-epimerase
MKGDSVMLSVSSFGTARTGQNVSIIELKNYEGMAVSLLNYGATVQAIKVLDRSGVLRDVCLGYNTVREYEDGGNFFGASIGRYANRIGGSKITIGNTEYSLTQNEGKNQLHGGEGFNKKIFGYRIQSQNSVTFTYTSPDGEDGFPGRLNVEIEYTLTDSGELQIRYTATTDKDTVVNLTNHSYFNLNGEGNGDILGHKLKLPAVEITEIDSESIPTGKLLDVKGTAFDFTSPKTLGQDIESDNKQLRLTNGYDHNYVLLGKGLKLAGCLMSEESGIKMSVLTTMPGVQLYSGNSISDCRGKSGNYTAKSGMCLETQFFPDSPNKPQFPSPVLKSGDTYKELTVYKFGTM